MNRALRSYAWSPIVLAAAFATTAAAALAADVYAPRPAEETRGAVLRWLTRRGIKEDKIVSRVAAVWTASGAASSGREVFDRLIESFCLADPATRKFVDACTPLTSPASFPNGDFLTRDDSDELYTANMRLFYARALTQRLMYDEALAVIARIDPARVADPATLFFYQAVCQHQLLQKKQGLETLDKLLHKTEGVAEPYTRVASLMHDELETLDDQSLDAISRKMQDSERRLDLGRGGQRVQRVQEQIVESLDEIIKKKEQQANPQSQSGEGENNSNRSNSPADDSSIKGTTAPGRVDKKNLKKQGSWGTLEDKKLPEAQNLLNREFPSNYRRAVEEYLKKMANKPSKR